MQALAAYLTGPPTGPPTGPTTARAKHLRERKVSQRKRTRDLYYKLDPLVPVCNRPTFDENGCLPSGRTFLQLAEDLVDYMRILKHGARHVNVLPLTGGTGKHLKSIQGEQNMGVCSDAGRGA